MSNDPFIGGLHPTQTEPAEWLVYADWLEEQSDPRAEFVRSLVNLRAETRWADRTARAPELAKMSGGFDKKWLADVGYSTAHVDVTANTFDETVAAGHDVLLLDFWAAWCGPCRMMAPTLEELGQKMAGWGRLGKIDVDAEPQLAQDHDVSAIPCVVLYSNGEDGHGLSESSLKITSSRQSESSPGWCEHNECVPAPPRCFVGPAVPAGLAR